MSEISLFVVSTPIGNLGDFSLRAREVLRRVDTILAEDTRTSGKLLKHYDIHTKMESFHAHNEHKVLPAIIERLKNGEVMAIITDAGTPAISDPGFILVREAVAQNISYTTVPGAAAFVSALILSGFPSDKFIYEGFIPHKKGRQSFILQWKEESRTVVFYESPHRIIKCLEQMLALLGPDREVAVVREITKKFEEVIRGTIAEVYDILKNRDIKGEFVVVLSGVDN